MSKVFAVVTAFALLCLGGIAKAEDLVYHAHPIYSGYAFDINNSGQVVGGDNSSAYLWDPTDGLTNVSMPSGSNGGMAWGLNDLGQVVGHAYGVAGSSNPKAFLWSSTSGAAVINDDMDRSIARDLHNDGIVVGEAGTLDGQTRATMWTATTGWVDTGLSEALSISNLGMIAGHSANVASLWSPQTGIFNIPIPDSSRSVATEVNDQGQAVGMYVSTSGEERAFYWSPSTGLSILPMLEGYNHSCANGINAAGQVVGILADLQPDEPDVVEAFIWSALDGFTLLGSGYAQAINDAGVVAGYVTDQTGDSTAVVWDIRPVPEPSAVVTLVCGLGLLGGALWRKRG